MEIAISHIAWSPEEEIKMAKLLPSLGVKAVEIAPGRIAPTIDSFKALWEENGVKISAMQALLFGRDDLVMFDSSEKRRRMLEYLSEIVEKAEEIGATRLVFGSPKNRRRGEKSRESVLPIAVGFFSSLADIANKHGVTICLEANPKEYGGDFILTTQEAAELVKTVNNEGFKLHLDTGGIVINNEDCQSLVCEHSEIIKHVHISAPFLKPIYEEKIPLHELISSLRKVNYQGFLSIEMKSLTDNKNQEHVRKAVQSVSEVLSG